MTDRPGRCVVINGGRQSVVVTADGATVVGEVAARWLLHPPDAPDADRLRRDLGRQPHVGARQAAVITAHLVDVGMFGADGLLANHEITVVEVTWDSFSMSPGQVANLVRAVVNSGHQVVVEFGSGASTVALAAALYVIGEARTLVSFEQDYRWLRRLEGPLATLRRPGVDVRALDCPLVPWLLPSPLPVARWFDAAAVTEVLRALPGPVDLLVVDGPTAFRPEWRFDRYPALPVVGAYLSEEAAVVLDDTARPSEREVLQQWQRELGGHWRAAEVGRATWLTRSPSR